MDPEGTYEDRLDAGDRLVAALREAEIDGDRILGVPRGALPVASRVADGLDLPLDVVVGRKVRHPLDSDLAVGAAGADGSVWIFEEFVEKWDVGEAELDDAVETAKRVAREKLDAYADGQLPPVEGETAIVVDDGAATGATARICLRQLQELGADRAVLAVPVASGLAMGCFEEVADEVVCPWVPPEFEGVWEYYGTFEQVSDEEALSYLD